ncbi:MAG: UDP-N-acetylmuramate dehydrogenase, partial [Planctomycetota bacterium]|nr:UDP-N-acetylmuramate dehydrogenase [Planctomycetota bacterium]
ADLLVSPRSIDALEALVRRARDEDMPLRVLGKGANLLVLDDGVDGIVVTLDHACFQVLEMERGGGSTLVRVGAGADLFKLMTDLARAGLAGMEHLAGIPGTVGGAVAMNAGGIYGDTAQSLHTVELVTPGGDRAVHPRTELSMAYRDGGLPAGVVARATFRVEPDDPAKVNARFREIFAWKKSRQPFGSATAGCMFKNPLDSRSGDRVSAGLLIDRAGLKGLRVGGAVVSQVHGNFVAQDAGGTASDIAALADLVAARVLDHCGIQLEREVVFWGRTCH